MEIQHNPDTFSLNENTRDSGIGLPAFEAREAISSPGGHTQYDPTSSSDNEDTSDDSSEGSSDSSWLQSNELGTTAISPNMAHCNLSDLSPINATKEPLNCFRTCINENWPKGWRGELQVLYFRLMHGGEFRAVMEEIDLSTPPHVRFDVSALLPLLEKKITNNKWPIKQIGTFVLPNIEEVTSGDVIKEMIESYCRAVGGKGTTVIKQLIIKCDKVSSNFVAGNLSWIKGFRACNNLDVIMVNSVVVVIIIILLKL